MLEGLRAVYFDGVKAQFEVRACARPPRQAPLPSPPPCPPPARAPDACARQDRGAAQNEADGPATPEAPHVPLGATSAAGSPARRAPAERPQSAQAGGARAEPAAPLRGGDRTPPPPAEAGEDGAEASSGSSPGSWHASPVWDSMATFSQARAPGAAPAPSRAPGAARPRAPTPSAAPPRAVHAPAPGAAVAGRRRGAGGREGRRRGAAAGRGARCGERRG